jgi:hypothetical protein
MWKSRDVMDATVVGISCCLCCCCCCPTPNDDDNPTSASGHSQSVSQLPISLMSDKKFLYPFHVFKKKMMMTQLSHPIFIGSYGFCPYRLPVKIVVGGGK